MEKGDVLIAMIAAVPGLLSLYLAWKKSPHDISKTNAETKKIEAEADSIYTQVADRWAEHVTELEGKINTLALERDTDKKELIGLRMDISQVRRENEMYRMNLSERDQVISDLKDWAERLLRQLKKHAPHVQPEQYKPTHSLKSYDAATGNGS